jgi:hypothetical protein
MSRRTGPHSVAPSMTRTLDRLLAVCAWAWLLGHAAGASAAPDDGERPAVVAPDNQVQFGVINRQQFEQWVFQGAQNAEGARARIDRRVELKLAGLERKHQLSESQRKKLELAARGDVKRLFDDVEVLRQKFLAAQNDGNAIGQLWQEIQPIQKKIAHGVLDEQSLFSKALNQTLDTTQTATQQAALQERRQFRYRAAVESAITMMEDVVALNQLQRAALIKLLTEKTKPPASFGQFDYQFVMYQLSQLPAAELRSLLDKRQQELLAPHLQQMRGMRQMLIENGALGAGYADE